VQNQNVGGYQSRGFVEVLAATQTMQKSEWFQGTADAVRSYLWLFEDAVRDGVQDYLILSGAENVLNSICFPSCRFASRYLVLPGVCWVGNCTTRIA
jgi:hypothetical protein